MRRPDPCENGVLVAMVLNEIERLHGHPRDKWDELKSKVQDRAVATFSSIESEWLDLMWTLDQYRIAGVTPRAMGKPEHDDEASLGAINRGKGNWFAQLLALILENQTDQPIASRSQVQGFSQTHQVDLAWPPRKHDVYVCVETKMTGAPATGKKPERRAMADLTNRRKELKFAATDLKLYRRQQSTRIEHWGVWRENARPKAYFLWGARLATGEKIDKLVSEARALVETYLDGAGILAWQSTGDAYVPVSIAPDSKVTTLDDVLYRIASEIRLASGPHREIPTADIPSTTVVDDPSGIRDEVLD